VEEKAKAEIRALAVWTASDISEQRRLFVVNDWPPNRPWAVLPRAARAEYFRIRRDSGSIGTSPRHINGFKNDYPAK